MLPRRTVHVVVVVAAVLVILFPLPTTPDWTAECISRYHASCRCTWSSGKKLADCNKSNMNSLPVLSNEIQILDMSNNRLSVLHDNAFINANLINLQKLYLKGCRISKVHDLAFNNLRILIELDMSHNEIEFLDPMVFSTNARLKGIKLNNNKLHTIRDFPVLDHFNHLDLSYNNLANLSYHTFSGLRNLKVLDLSYNQFGNISPDIFPQLSSLGLRGNNWVCDCELKALRDYVVMNKFYEPELRCSEPLSLFNSPWDGFNELSCKPEILHILANGKIVDSIVALENTLVLSCVVKGDPLPDVKWVKNGRVVQEAERGVDSTGGVVMLNLTVGRHDNEFVCVGSNTGGVVERNLTVTLDEAGLSGFVVLQDKGDGVLGGREKGGLVIYLVIGVVFLSLIVGLVVGGVCVWRWGQRGQRNQVEQDSVVKGVLKTEDTDNNCGAPNDDDGNRSMIVMHSERDFNIVEQSPLLKPHASADDLLDNLSSSSPRNLRHHQQRPTPDLLINNGGSQSPNEDDDELSNFNNKFPPQDSSSLYDNYEFIYRPLLGGGNDSLRRYCIANNTLQRPSSVCSEARVLLGNNSPARNTTSSPVILPVASHHGYVTLPRRSVHNNSKRDIVREQQMLQPLPIKYDNLGPRTTADGSSNMSINDAGVDPNNPQVGTPPASAIPPLNHFEPIIEQPVDEETAVDDDDVPVPPPAETKKKKFRPVPPPKPKKKPAQNDGAGGGSSQFQSDDSQPVSTPANDADDDDDGTEV